MIQSIFRAYDVRGIVDEEITPEVATLLGKAIGTRVRESGNDCICVGYDGRLSSPSLAEALIAGLVSTGCHVLNLGAVPTPLTYFATYETTATSSVMVTGSHNPANYNGFKMVINHETLAQDAIQGLYQLIVEEHFIDGEGCVEDCDVKAHYLETVCNKVKLTQPLKVVLDAGNGIAGALAPELFTRLGCDVVPLYCDVDGTFPNHHPDPTQPENLRALIDAVKTHEAHCGLAFDGDGDRVGIVSDKGNMIFADELIILLLPSLLKANPGKKILFDVKCTAHLAKAIKAQGGEPVMGKTGHSLIKKMLQTDKDIIFAGEMSGHLFFKDDWYGFDDGLYVAARLCELLAEETRSCDELFATLPHTFKTPEIKIAIDESNKFDFVKRFCEQASFPDATVNKLDGLRAEYKDGWGLLRASNTTPYLIARFEADDQEALNKIKQAFALAIGHIDENLDLRQLA